MTFRFDEFRLEGDTRRLLHRDREVHLSPKAFDLLHALIEHRARAMSRTELHERLWPSTFVQDSNLAGLAAEVRRALDDSADEPRYLRTVPRFGYWFIGQVTDGATPPSDRSPARCWLLWAGRQIALELGENILGRAPDATVWIDAASVSRQHARIRIDGTSAVLEDLGSKNGTFLRGERLTGPRPLMDADEIQLGSVVVIFRIPSRTDETVSVPD